VNLRRTVPLVLAPLLLVIAAACGGDDDDSASATTAAPATTAAGASVTTAGSTSGTSGSTAATAASTAATAAGATTPAVTGGTGTGGKIVVGSADFPESQLLAQIYGQALDGAGFDVSYQMAIGAREVYFKAIDNGEIDLVPEYTNSLLSFVLRLKDPNALPTAKNVDEQITALGDALPDGLEVLTPSTAEDKDTIVCTADAAQAHNLTDLASLAAASKDITIGAQPEFETRSPYGLAGFKQIYGAEFKKFVPLTFAAIVDALKAEQIDCGNLTSTSSAITTNGFVALTDEKGLVPNEAVLPLVRTDVVTPEMEAALANVNKQLNTEVLKQLMVKVEVDAAAPDVVAQQWLSSLE
jgi:osmoprotectant transport system substrate-binding protein